MGLSNPCHLMIHPESSKKTHFSCTHFQNQKIHECMNHLISTYTNGQGTFDPPYHLWLATQDDCIVYKHHQRDTKSQH